MQSAAKDGWDKADVILKPLGGFLTALAVAYVGILGSQYLKNREAVETDTQLYAQLLSRKQDTEIEFRREILKPIIEKVEAPGSLGVETRMLNLELLAANFQESLDLGPFLKHMYLQLDPKIRSSTAYLQRLESDAAEIKTRQIVTLAGERIRVPVDVKDLVRNPAGIRVIDQDLRLHSENLTDPEKRHFALEVLEVNRSTRELLVRLKVTTPKSSDKHVWDNSVAGVELDMLSWVGLFDFPMSHNISLSHGPAAEMLAS